MKQKEHEHEIGDVRIRYEFGRAQNSGDAETLKGERFCLKTRKTGSITGTACFEHGVLWVWHTNHYSEAPLRLKSLQLNRNNCFCSFKMSIQRGIRQHLGLSEQNWR